MVFKRNHFFKIGMWHSRPPRDPPPFMAKTILNFHFDYWNPSLTQCLQPQKMRPNPERRSQKGAIIPENKTRPHLFPSHLSLPRCCSISGRMLMPAAFLWCVTRSKTKLRHKHFLDPLILTLYVQYRSTTRQIVFAYVSHLTLTGPWHIRML